MPLNVIQANQVLTAGLQANFSHTYATSAKASMEKMRKMVEFDVPAPARVTPLGYFESAEIPEHWPYGEEIPEGTNEAVSYNVTIRRWAKRIKWNRDDVSDEMTHTLKQRATQLGERFGTLHERVFFQLVLGSTDPSLLPVVPNAPDGAAFFATTAGGANRFGVANGNLLTGNGIADPASILRDYYLALVQFTRMLDTKGQPLHDIGKVEGGLTILFGTANTEVFDRAFYGTIQQGVAAGISNPLKDAGRNFQLWPTPRITTNDWYVFMTGDPLKPIGQFTKEGMETTEADWSNSDESRSHDIGYFQAKARYGYVINLPYQALQINN